MCLFNPFRTDYPKAALFTGQQAQLQCTAQNRSSKKLKCSLIGHTNNRPSLLSIIEDLAKFGHSYSSVANRRPQSSAMQSPIGAYGLVLRCRRSAHSVLKGLTINVNPCHVHPPFFYAMFTSKTWLQSMHSKLTYKALKFNLFEVEKSISLMKTWNIIALFLSK